MRRELLLPLLVACGGGGDTDLPAVCDDEPSIEIGTGVQAFEPVNDGGELPLIRGPQGGYHLPGAVRACGLAQGSLVIAFTAVEQSTGTTVTDVTYDRITRPDGDCCVYVADLIGYVFIPYDTGAYVDPVSFLDGRTVEITLTVTDADGTSLTDTLTVVVTT